MARSAGTAGALDRGLAGSGTTPRRFRKLRVLVGFVAVVLLASYAGMLYVDRIGNRFFNTGRSIVHSLEEVARAAKAKDITRMQSRFAADFTGSRLGLTSMN